LTGARTGAIAILFFRQTVLAFVRTVAIAQTSVAQGVPKNDPTCFCQNFIKSPPNLIIFGTQIAKTIERC